MVQQNYVPVSPIVPKVSRLFFNLVFTHNKVWTDLSFPPNLYAHICHANCDSLMVIESYLQHDQRTEWSKFLQAKFPLSSPTFNSIWKILLQLLLVFLFNPSIFHFKLYKFLLNPLQL